MSDGKPDLGDGLSAQLRRLLEETDSRLVVDTTPITSPGGVKKMTALMPVSCCALTDATGENHCDHPAPLPPPRLTRLRWRISSWWSSLRMKVGSWVAGVDLEDSYDD